MARQITKIDIPEIYIENEEKYPTCSRKGERVFIVNDKKGENGGLAK